MSQRISLIRKVVELQSLQVSLETVWLAYCQQISQLLSAREVAVVLRSRYGDQLVCACLDGVCSTVDHGVPTAFAREVLQRNVTIVRGEGAADTSIGVPIRFGPTLLGVICAEGAPHPDAELVTLLESCALSAGARLHAEAADDSRAASQRLAFVDALTGIANRRRFDEELPGAWMQAAAEGKPLGLLMIDVDHFKRYNDAYGHPAGDECLRRVAGALQTGTRRAADLCARYGGEEFVVLLPDANLEDAMNVAERLNANITQLAIPHEGSAIGVVSVSIGVASTIPPGEQDASALIAAADAGLYEAKRDGRNRAVTGTSVVAKALTNIPPQAPLIGRASERVEIERLLEESALVTLTAWGGVGKTRLSLSVAAGYADRCTDGTWFVDLTSVRGSERVAAAVGLLFGAEVPSGDAGISALVHILAAKRCLLVLDNCEHVLEGAARVASALLSGCPGLRILATSREPLGIGGEAVFRLPLLTAPAAGEALDARTAGTYDAVSLFVDRARSVDPDFALTDDNAAAIGTICRQLDGIALAIELAAARVRSMDLREIEGGLVDRLRLLEDEEASDSPRPHTLRALIDWSYHLLSADEQQAFRRASVFAGGWTLEAMAEICSGGSIDAFDFFDLLAGLVRKSLVVDSITDSSSRYRLLESVREYGLEKLAGDPDCREVYARHARYFLSVARENGVGLVMHSNDWLVRLAPETENFRLALRWALVDRNDLALGVALAGALVTFFAEMWPSEGLRWVRLALTVLPPQTEPSIEASLWYGLGLAAENLPAAELRRAAERAVTLARTVGNRRLVIYALRQLVLALGLFYSEETGLIDELASEALAAARELEDPLLLALALRSYSLTIPNANVATKAHVLEESLSILMAHGTNVQIAIAYMWLAEFRFCLGDTSLALDYGRRALHFARRAGSAVRIVQMATNVAQYTAAEGDFRAALHSAIDAAKASSKLGVNDEFTWSVQTMAVACAGLGNDVDAARLLGFCDRRFGTLHGPRQADSSEEYLYERLIADLRGRLDPATLEASLRAGAELTETGALAIASSVESACAHAFA